MNPFKGLFQGKVKEVLDSAFNGLDGIVTSKEELAKIKLQAEQEMNRHAEAVESNANDMIKAQLADTADSREANVRIQESDKASWLAKNVGYLIDITVIYGFLAMFIVIIYRAVPEANKELFYMAFGSLATFAGTSINWHRGSSQGSAEKQKFLDKVFRR